MSEVLGHALWAAAQINGECTDEARKRAIAAYVEATRLEYGAEPIPLSDPTLDKAVMLLREEFAEERERRDRVRAVLTSEGTRLATKAALCHAEDGD